MTENRNELVFVYGTLKTGFYNNYLLDDADLIAYGETEQKYMMTESGIPFVTKQAEISTIKGEVYSLSPIDLSNLDVLESHPTWYKREQVNVVDEDGVVYLCWLYFNNLSMGDKINIDGDYGNTVSRFVYIDQLEKEKEEEQETNQTIT